VSIWEKRPRKTKNTSIWGQEWENFLQNANAVQKKKEKKKGNEKREVKIGEVEVTTTE